MHDGLSKDQERSDREAASADNLLAVARGGGLLAAADLIDYVTRLVAALWLARLFGAEEYGLYTVAVSAAFLLNGVARLGLDAAMERYLPILRARDDRAGEAGTLQFGLGASSVGALAVSTAVWALADPIAQSVFGDPRLAPLLRLVGFVGPFVMTTTILAAVVRGYRRMDYSALAEHLVQPVIRLLLIAVIVPFGINAMTAFVILGISYTAATFVLITLIRQLVRSRESALPARRDVKEIVFFSFPFWFGGIINQTRKNIQPLLLGAYSNLSSPGIFSIATSATLPGVLSLKAIRLSVRPLLAVALDRGDLEQAKTLYRTTTRWALMMNLPFTLIIILYPTAVLGVFGESFEAGSTALTILGLQSLVIAATGTNGTVIDMSGFNRLKVVNNVFEFAFSMTLNVVLIINYGLVGAAIAVTVSVAVIEVVRTIEVYVILGLHPYDRSILKPLFAALVACSAGMGINQLLPASSSLAALLVDAAVVGTVYLAGIALLGLNDEERAIGRAVRERTKLPVPPFLR